MSANQCERLATESTEDREARLQRMCANQLSQLRTQKLDSREWVLIRVKDWPLSQLKTEKIDYNELEKGNLVLAENLNHSNSDLSKWKWEDFMTSLSSPKCSTCLESFPGIQLRSPTTECMCSRDKHAPKVFSSANNIDPGALLQVSTAASLLAHYPKLLIQKLVFIISVLVIHSWKHMIGLFKTGTGFESGGRDVDYCCAVHHVPVQTTHGQYGHVINLGNHLHTGIS